MKTISELISLTGKRILITGATGSIGKQIALTIAELGGDLLLSDRPKSDYRLIKHEICKKWNVDVDSIDCDLEDNDSRKSLINSISTSGMGVDVLINNAAFVGTSDLDGWVEDFKGQTVDTWRRALEVNLTAAFHLSQGLAPLLGSKGVIINISSIYGCNAPDYSLYAGTEMGNPAAYSVSKGGLIQLTRWLASTIAPNVRVNCISPGGVWRNQPDEFVERYKKRTLLNRMATEEDFKGVIAYLSSDLSAYVTGQNIIVDGGWSL